MSYNITVTMDQLTVTDATESTPLVTIRKPSGGGSSVTVDTALSTSSYNAIANAPVATAINTVNASLTDLEGDVTNLQSQISSVGSIYPTVVTQASAMSDTTAIYLYDGSEEGYTAGDWYYYNGSAWVDGGTYGTGRISTNGRNLLLNILRRLAYIDEETDTLITALGNELATAVITGYRTISFALTHVTSTEGAQSVQYGDPFTCTLTPASGYAQIDSITVTMGGSDVTASVYNNGTITIPSVTGDVVVTAVAEWEIVRSLTSDDLYTGRFSLSTPYYTTNTSSVQRVIYKEFDIPVEYGYTYKIEYTTTVTGKTTNVGLAMYNQNVLDYVASSQPYGSSDMYDEGWLDSGATVTPPESVNSSPIKGTRISFRAGTGTTTITAANFPTVLLTRKAV